MKKLINWFKGVWETYQKKKRFRKKLEELRKRDPFTYNH